MIKCQDQFFFSIIPFSNMVKYVCVGRREYGHLTSAEFNLIHLKYDNSKYSVKPSVIWKLVNMNSTSSQSYLRFLFIVCLVKELTSQTGETFYTGYVNRQHKTLLPKYHVYLL